MLSLLCILPNLPSFCTNDRAGPVVLIPAHPGPHKQMLCDPLNHPHFLLVSSVVLCSYMIPIRGSQYVAGCHESACAFGYLLSIECGVFHILHVVLDVQCSVSSVRVFMPRKCQILSLRTCPISPSLSPSRTTSASLDVLRCFGVVPGAKSPRVMPRIQRTLCLHAYPYLPLHHPRARRWSHSAFSSAQSWYLSPYLYSSSIFLSSLSSHSAPPSQCRFAPSSRPSAHVCRDGFSGRRG